MLTRAAKQRQAERETPEQRQERIGRQTPPPTLHRAVMGGSTRAPAPATPVPKLTRRQKVRQDVRDSARGEECTVRIPGICTADSSTVIWSHARWPGAGKGGATKAFDLCGCYACTACDAVYDGQANRPAGMEQDEVDMAWMHGHLRSMVRLAEKGLL